MIASIRWKHPTNAGDIACGIEQAMDAPVHQLSFLDALEANVEALNAAGIKNILVGGGGLLNKGFQSKEFPFLLDAGFNLFLCGVGHNESDPSFRFSLKHPNIKFVGCRDYKILAPGQTYMPCPSISLPFEKYYKDPRERNIPMLICDNMWHPTGISSTNISTTQPYEKLIETISRSRMVISSSYHTALWATWLGCRVAISKPWSQKLTQGRWKWPVVSSFAEAREVTQAFPDSLEQDRHSFNIAMNTLKGLLPV